MDESLPAAVRQQRIVFLDYLRVFAFVSVLIGHKFNGQLQAFVNDPSIHATPRALASLLLPLTFSGGVGVVVFFLVSGYIIAHVLQAEKAGEFLVKRIFRIYPLYMVAVLLEYAFLVAEDKAPGLRFLVPQLLLVGDFFGTPYSLKGVEWTLRIEVMFYLVMAALGSSGLMTRFRKGLPYALVGVVLLCGFLAPVPRIQDQYLAYSTLYGSLLFAGVAFYLLEKKQVSQTFFLCFVGLIFYQHYHLMALYQKNWLGVHFAGLALLIFILLWAWRSRWTAPLWILFLSDLTYSVYLFHNWFFDYAKTALAKFNITWIHLDLQALAVLLLVCWLAVKWVEKPGIHWGRRMVERFGLGRQKSVAANDAPTDGPGGVHQPKVVAH